MKITGFTFIRNALLYDYPIIEAIQSILPICQEVVVAVGASEDKTLDMLQSIDNDKIRIVETVWDDTLRSGGRVLAAETDKAFRAISEDSDWAFYIQGDEVLHEKYVPVVRTALERYKNTPEVDGLLFNYLHFYGSYDYVGEASKWYRREVRIIKNNPTIYSYRDAQGFRKGKNQKLNVKLINAFIHHYGWVKPPQAQQKKQETFHKLWHDDVWVEKNVAKKTVFDYTKVDALRKFEGTHPQVMQARIEQKNWIFDHDLSKNQLGWKDQVKNYVEKYTNWRPGEYKNYIVI